MRDEVSKSSQLIYISSGLKTYLRFLIPVSACTDWSMQGLCMSPLRLTLCIPKLCVEEMCSSYVSIIILQYHYVVILW